MTKALLKGALTLSFSAVNLLKCLQKLYVMN